MKRSIGTMMLLASFLVAGAVAQGGVVTPRLERAVAAAADGPRQADGTWAVWVTFMDKGVAAAGLDAALTAAEQRLSPRALERRAKAAPVGARLVDARDLPLSVAYTSAVAATGARPRRESSWLNAASYNATAAQIDAIAQLPMVAKVDLVARFRRDDARPTEQEIAIAAAAREAAAGSSSRWTLDYGGSTAGLEQINVPPAHQLGLSGHGVVIAMLDGGFRLSHDCVRDVPVVAQWDFVHDDGNVQLQPGDNAFQDRHGLQTLSTIMGFRAGELVGPAYGASAILAMTEDTGSETQIEEDNWVAAVEWVEGLGADLISSSLGYYYWYDFSDLDGNTAVTTVAADLAVARGMPVFVSAGNERGNAAFPHILAPADGDSVVAASAVNLDGVVASFSSPGPTFDGRIKPDLAAQGVGNFVAAYYDDHLYSSADGTSFAAPLLAGVAALMLERVPSLTPMQIREALRATADRAAAPDNDYGWGIIDAFAAVAYWGPLIEHDGLPDTEDLAGPYVVSARITSRAGLTPGSLVVRWRRDGGPWQQAPLSSAGGDAYVANLPGQPVGGLVEYYLAAADADGIVIVAPHGAPDRATYRFRIGTDTTPPTLFHPAAIDQTPATWPPLLWAEASDNVAIAGVALSYTLNGGAPQGPFAFAPVGGRWELSFPLSPAAIRAGDVIRYQVTASDAASVPNLAVSGPHEVRILASRGSIMVIDNATFRDGRSSVLDITQWLIDAGYTPTVFAASDVVPSSVEDFDAVFLVCGNNQHPIGLPLLRSALINYASRGGRVMVEGGAVAETAFNSSGYLEFATAVLHAAEYWGDMIGPMTALNGLEHHPLLVRPHLLPEVIEQDVSAHPYDYASSDFVRPADAVQVLRSLYIDDVGGVLVHDDDTGPEAAQTVYITFDLGYLDPAVARQLVENGLALLLARQAPGAASIAGRVTLFDDTDASGVTVAIDDDHTVVTGPDGHFVLAGLHGSTYRITAAKAGYGAATRTVVLQATEQATGVDFQLLPITPITYTAQPEVAIPDNNVAGIVSTVTVGEMGVVNGLNVDIDISHTSIGNLLVTLTSPSGRVVTLHNRSGATADDIVGNWPGTLIVDGPGSLGDFAGEPVAGVWTLSVSDRQFGATGRLHSWGLNLLVSPAEITAAPTIPTAATGLLAVTPNPFNPQAKIAFALHASGPANLEVFDLRGRRVRQLLTAVLPAGRHEVAWDGRDDDGRSLASGTYVCRLNAGAIVDRMRMTLVR